MLEFLKQIFGEDKTPVRIVIEGFSILTGIGFFLSATLNSIVFYAWGLNFFALAGPSDVIGFGMFFTLLEIIAISVPAGVISLTRRFGSIFLLILFLPTWAVLVLLVRYPMILVQNLILTFVIALIHVAGFAAIVAVSQTTATHALRSRFVWIVVVFGLLSAMLFLLFCAGDGFVAGNKFVAMQGEDRPCTVLWTGERAIVARCQGGAIRMIYGPENVTIQ